MTNKILTAMALALMSIACTQKVDQPLQYGEISVALAGDPAIDVATKAAVELSAEEAAAYTVRIFDIAGTKKYESTYKAFEAQRLPLGTYYVTAESCSETSAEEGHGKMRLYGRSADLTLSTAALQQTAKVDCTVSNAKVSVAFDSSVSGRFDGLKVVFSKKDRTLEVPESAIVTETWFNPSEVSYTISGIFTATGKNVTLTGNLSLEAKDNIKLVVKVSLDNGQILVPTITVDTTIGAQEEKTEEFNPYE